MVRKREHEDVCTLIFDVYKSVLPKNIVRTVFGIHRSVLSLVGNLCFGRLVLDYYKIII